MTASPPGPGGVVTTVGGGRGGVFCPLALSRYRRPATLAVATAPAGDPAPEARVILPGAYQLRSTATFAPSGPSIPAGTPTRVVRFTDTGQWAPDGRPLILAEVEVWSDPAGSRRRGFVPLALSDLRPGPEATPQLLDDLLEAYRLAAARMGPPPAGPAAPAVVPPTPTSPATPPFRYVPPPMPASASPGVVLATGIGAPALRPSASSGGALSVSVSLQQSMGAWSAPETGMSATAKTALAVGGVGAALTLLYFLLRRSRDS